MVRLLLLKAIDRVKFFFLARGSLRYRSLTFVKFVQSFSGKFNSFFTDNRLFCRIWGFSRRFLSFVKFLSRMSGFSRRFRTFARFVVAFRDSQDVFDFQKIFFFSRESQDVLLCFANSHL